METATIISRRTRYHQRRAVQSPAISNSYHPERSVKRYKHQTVMPFLILVYIFNGTHDPQKIHWLNFTLSALFFVGGFTLNQDFLSVGAMFLAITLLNIGCVWIVQRFDGDTWSPAIIEMSSQLHVSIRYYTES